MIGIVAIVGLITLVDPNQLKGLMSQQLEKSTGYNLTIQGPIYWSISPEMAIDAFDLVLSKPTTSPNKLLSIKKARITTSFKSLLSLKNLFNVELQGLTLDLSHPSFQANLKNLKALSEKPLFSRIQSLYFLPNNLTITDGSITWHDFYSHGNFQIKNLDFSAKKIHSGMAGLSVPIDFNFCLVEEATQYSSKISVNTEWHHNQQLQQFDIQDLKAKAEFEGRESTTLIADLQILDTVPLVKGKCQLLNFSLPLWLSKFNPTLYAWISNPLDFKGIFHYQYPSLEFRSFTVALDKGSLDGNLKAKLENLSLQTFLGSGYFQLKGVTLGTLPLKELKTQFEASNGIFKFNNITADMINCQHQGQLKIDFTDPIPKLSISDQINTTEINDPLTALGENDKIYGKMQGNAELFTKGSTVEECIQNLSGQAHISLVNGKLGGIELPKLLQHAQTTVQNLYNNLLKKQSTNIEAILTAELGEWKLQALNNESLKTPFNSIETDITVDNGVLRTSNFKLINPEFTINGHAEIDLLHKNIESQASALLNHPIPTHSEDLGLFLKESPLSIQIKGPLNNLLVRPDLARYADRALNFSPKERGKEAEHPEKKLDKDNALEKLFGFQ